MSKAWFATSFFNRAFSTSSSFRRLASVAFIPPYWDRHLFHVASEISNVRSTSVRSAPPPSSRSPSRSFRITCSGVCRCRFIVIVLLAHSLGSRTLTTPGPLRRAHANVTLHRLRHTVATVLVGHGQILQAQQRLGHPGRLDDTADVWS